MKAKKVLFITTEMLPFVGESHNATMGRYLPQAIQDLGHEIRTFTPKWGNINERRNQLHEVIRLSGMNLIIDETDHPLIIKVASLQAAHMQIYFIDNDDYFMKRQITTNEAGEEYDDNGERAIFYARGVLETLKKLRWVPDVIHCHGWISALAPLYIKKAYQDEPSFCDAKVVFSVGADDLKKDLGRKSLGCIPFKGAVMEDVNDVCQTQYTQTELMKIATKFSDGIIIDKPEVDPSIVEYAKSIGVPVLAYQGEEYAQAYSDFYETVV